MSHNECIQTSKIMKIVFILNIIFSWKLFISKPPKIVFHVGKNCLFRGLKILAGPEHSRFQLLFIFVSKFC